MKRFFSAGEGCALYNNIILISGFIIFIIFNSNLTVKGQDVNNVLKHQNLVLGDTIPDSFWDIPLKVVNHPNLKDSITLREYKNNRLVILDFWASWCKPCIISVDKWESIKDSIPEMAVIPIHYDHEHLALPFIKSKEWTLPHVVGLEYRLLNKYFFRKARITRSIWILDNRLIAITDQDGPGIDQIRLLLTKGRGIPSHMQGTHSFTNW